MVKESKFLSLEKTFRALHAAYKHIERNKDRLDKPYFCPYDGVEFMTEIDLDLHMFQEHNQKPVYNKLIIERYAMLKPFLDQGIITKKGIWNSLIKRKVSVHCIYRWMLVYKKKGIKGLAQKEREKGKRSKRFPNKVYQILEDNVINFDEKKMSMNKCWEKIVKECKAEGYKISQIPSTQTVRNKIHIYKNGLNNVKHHQE